MAVLALVAAGVVGIAVVALFMGLGRAIEPRDSIKQRLDVFAPVPATVADAESQPRDKKLHPLAQRLNRAISRRGFAASVALELARADVPLTVPEYVLLHIAIAGILFLAIQILSRQVILSLASAAVGLLLPRLYLQTKQAKRLVAFQDQLPDVLTLVVGSLRSGYGITIAMDAVAKQMPPPAADEFARVVREIGLGLAITQALSNLVGRICSDDLDLMVTAIAIQYEVGGNLATILETITDTIRERIRLKGQLRTLTAQQGLQRSILTGLPIALAVVMYILNPVYIKALFTPGVTLVIPVAAVVLLIAGYFVMGKLGKIEF